MSCLKKNLFTCEPKRFAAANSEQIGELGAQTIPLTTNQGIQRCITFGSASVSKLVISMQKVVRIKNNIEVPDEKNPHTQNTRYGMLITRDANSRVYTKDMWICLEEKLAGTASGQTTFDKRVRLAAPCRGGETEVGVQEREDGTSDEEGVVVEGKMAPPDWRVRAGPRNRPTQKERQEHKATHVPFRDWCTHCMMGRPIITSQNKKGKINREGPQMQWTITSCT